MTIAGRKQEMQILQDALHSAESEFIAMYGRRRVGKTFLIRETYKKQLFFEASGVNESSMQTQLQTFGLAMQEQLPRLKTKTPPTNWIEAFHVLRICLQTATNKNKKVIFFDEISWFDTPRSGFLAALDLFWNQFCSKRKDIVLIICGSAASWIINKIVNNKGGLHNRITRTIRLLPFTLAETKEYLWLHKIKLVNKDIIELYMAVGGVPFYLKDVKAGQSIAQIIDELCFKKNAKLANEFGNLYASLFKNSDQHVAIVKALAKVNKGLTRQQLVSIIKLKSGGTLTVLLKELMECGFVDIIYPVNKKSEDALYRLVDEFTIFYLKFMQSNSGTKWLLQSKKSATIIWQGFAFENICIKHVEAIKHKLGISGVLCNHYSWIAKKKGTYDGAQIDLLIDRDDNCINICEIKYYNKPYVLTKQGADKLKNKKDLFETYTNTTKNIFTTLITTNGIISNQYSLSAIQSTIITDDLFF